MALLGTFLSSRIHHGTLTIVDSDGKRAVYGRPAEGWPNATLRLHAANAERRILLNPSLGLAEAYIDGRVSVDDDDIMGLVELVRRNNPWEAGGLVEAGKLKDRLALLARPFQQLNSLARSRANVAHHYNLSNDFYRLWLDEDMQYSCAYWPEGVETLEQAQMAKKAHIVAKLALQPGQRVLDIGCGWGGMALYLNRVADVEVLGITLSEEQLKLARERAEAAGVSGRVKFELIDYRDLVHREPQGFDRIVSVGMLEHVGVPQFETYFHACANLMKDDGVFLMHTIGRMGEPGNTDKFTRKYIFPGGYIPSLSETVAASEKAKLIAADVENLRLHYAKTLRHWYERVDRVRDQITACYDEKFLRLWRFYLAGAATAFEGGSMCNYQVQYIRNRYTLPITRGYMADAEKKLLALG